MHELVLTVRWALAGVQGLVASEGRVELDEMALELGRRPIAVVLQNPSWGELWRRRCCNKTVALAPTHGPHGPLLLRGTWQSRTSHQILTPQRKPWLAFLVGFWLAWLGFWLAFWLAFWAGLAWLSGWFGLASGWFGLAHGWLSGWFGLAPGWFGLAPGWLSGWFGLAPGWFGLAPGCLAGFLAGLVWLLAGFLAGLVLLLAGFLAGLAWLSFFPCFF